MKSSNWLLGIAGLAIWWLCSFLVWTGPLGVLAVLATILACGWMVFRFEKHPLIVLLWVPLVVCAGLIVIGSVRYLFWLVPVWNEGNHPQNPASGIAAVFALVLAVPILLAGGLSGLFLRFAFKHRPRPFPQPLAALAAVNIVALLAIHFSNSHEFSKPFREPIVLQISDSLDRPVAGVKIDYSSYATRADGGDAPSPYETASSMTDSGGEAKISPDPFSRYVTITLSKGGYCPVSAAIRNDDVDLSSLSGRHVSVQVDGARSPQELTLSNQPPMSLKLYLPTSAEGPKPLRQSKFFKRWPVGIDREYISLSDGVVSDTAGGDLMIQAGAPGEYRITALNGGSLAVAARDQTGFAALMDFAPAENYAPSLEIPGFPTVYYRGPGDSNYTQIKLEIENNLSGREGSISGNVSFGANGSRCFLEKR